MNFLSKYPQCGCATALLHLTPDLVFVMGLAAKYAHLPLNVLYKERLIQIRSFYIKITPPKTIPSILIL